MKELKIVANLFYFFLTILLYTICFGAFEINATLLFEDGRVKHYNFPKLW